MPAALFLSPHLDDVAFSCAGTLPRLRAAGWDICLVTVFTASVADPSGFALRCQTDKGLGADVDYMALRRGEDRAFARIAGLSDVRWWPLPEAPHRGYFSAPELFAGIKDGDTIWRAVAERLRTLDAELSPQAVFAPQGLGGHVDHLHVIRAVREAGLAGRTCWYRDTPYAIREPDARQSPLLPDGLEETATALDEDTLTRKIAGACAYASQIGFQFGGPEETGRGLREFAHQEAARAGLSGYAERFQKPRELLLPAITYEYDTQHNTEHNTNAHD